MTGYGTHLLMLYSYHVFVAVHCMTRSPCCICNVYLISVSWFLNTAVVVVVVEVVSMIRDGDRRHRHGHWLCSVQIGDG